jgi:hypothetical protein
MLEGRRRVSSVLVGGATLLALTALSARASAQESAKSRGPGFGERDSFVLSVERILGYQSQTVGQNCNSAGDCSDETLDSAGFHPLYWSGLGLHSVMSSGLTVGALIGYTYLSEESASSNSSGTKASLVFLRPRIGYAGSVQKGLGYWLRIGPTVLLSIDHKSSDTGDKFHDIFAAGGEAYAVIEAAPHVDVLLGPHVEIFIGSDTKSEKYSSVGLTLGLAGDFY